MKKNKWPFKNLISNVNYKLNAKFICNKKYLTYKELHQVDQALLNEKT